MSLPVITMLQFLDEGSQLQKFFNLRGKLVTCFSVKGLTLAERIEQFERTRDRIAAHENATIRFLHLEDVEITAFRAIQRSRFYMVRSKLDAAETFKKLVEALPGGRLERSLLDHIQRAENGMPLPSGNLISEELIEAEFRRDEEEEPTLPAYHFGQPFAATREPGWDLPVFKGLDPVPVGHVRTPSTTHFPDGTPIPTVLYYEGRPVTEAEAAQIERDNRFGQPQPWGEPRPDPVLDPQDDPRIPHANTMADPNREARGFVKGIAILLLLGASLYALWKLT